VPVQPPSAPPARTDRRYAPRPLLNTRGGSASAALTPEELPALASVSPGGQYRVTLLVCFADNSTEALTANVEAMP